MQDLLQLMYQDGHLSSTELNALQRASRQLKENPIKILRSLNIATPGEIRELLQRYYGFSAATDKLIEELDDSLRGLLPADIALHYCALPIAEENGEIYILMEDPTDKGAISQLEFLTDKKVIPVIATVQQLSNGLCRLYGVEPGRLKLSGVLEASRGAVGITGVNSARSAHFIDDSQPLLDDEVYINLKQSSKRARKNRRIEALRPEAETDGPAPKGQLKTDSSDNTQEQSHSAVTNSSMTSTVVEGAAPHSQVDGAERQAPPSPESSSLPMEESTHSEPTVHENETGDAQLQTAAPFSLQQIEPDFVAAMNHLGLSLTLAPSRSEAVKMVNARLSDFAFTLHLLENDRALIVWSGSSYQTPLTELDSRTEIPAQFRTLLKKISQCRTE